MAEVRFALGAVADIATSNEVHKAVSDSANNILGGLKKPDPIRRKIIGGGNDCIATNMPFGGGGLADFLTLKETPAQGRYWSLRSVTIHAADAPFTLVHLTSNYAALCAGQPDFGNPGDVVYWVIAGQSGLTNFPVTFTFNSNSINIENGQYLYLATAHGAISDLANLQIIGQVEEYVKCDGAI